MVANLLFRLRESLIYGLPMCTVYTVQYTSVRMIILLLSFAL